MGQDTIAVYFETGRAVLKNHELRKLDTLEERYAQVEIDSIQFIGIADSVGDVQSNYILSEKRARYVANYCAEIFPEDIHSTVSFLGEKTDSEPSKNRKVEVIIYPRSPHKKVEKGDPNNTASSHPNLKEKQCHNVYYKLLQHCSIRYVKEHRKEKVIIELSNPELIKNKELYYGSTTFDGSFRTRRIKWKTEVTGMLWWSKTRYRTLIPKKDFETYKIFSISEPPCDSCSERFHQHISLRREGKCKRIDRFLMEEMQAKKQWFGRKNVKVRVPREYVNLNDKFFIGCNLQHEIEWETKNRFWNKNYYYTELPNYVSHLANITRVMSCCKNDPTLSDCDQPYVYTKVPCEAEKSFIIKAEVGSYFQRFNDPSSKIFPYIGLGLRKEGSFGRGSIMAGVDLNPGFYGALRYQYHFLSFPYSWLNPFSNWQQQTEKNMIYKYGRFYVGSEVRARINTNDNTMVEQNLHLGFAGVNTAQDALVSRLFIQYGVGIDYLDLKNPKPYSNIQIGLNLKLVRFGND